jgi:D-alanyl-lipoteichoic acid acyltransferase DltB (MBOAT superfamily)
MLFNSFGFLFIFLPLTVFGFYILGGFRNRLGVLWLCGASLFFFADWNQRYLWLLVGSVIMNYLFGGCILRISDQYKGVFLAFSILINIGILAYYKYAGFLCDNLNALFTCAWSLGKIILPLGVSFFTFTQIAYLTDCRQGKVSKSSFIDYLLFVTYFPHLIAGPILHHACMIPQFRLAGVTRVEWNNCATGLVILSIGLAKKLLLADNLSVLATPVFDRAHLGNIPLMAEAWAAVIAYSLQLYFDFSGYCDMAVGISLFFNIRLPVNFNSPYKSTSIIDFWRRWHITLSNFLRDYLYIPLGGNRKGSFRRYFKVLLTMLIGGLWHGAGWNFLIWGALHGIYLMVNHSFRSFCRFNLPDVIRPIIALLSVAFTYLCVLLGWVFFRSQDLMTASRMLRGMVGMESVTWKSHAPLELYCFLYICLLIVWIFPNSQEITRYTEYGQQDQEWGNQSLVKKQWNPESWIGWVMPGLLLGISLLIMTNGKPSEFLYFQF